MKFITLTSVSRMDEHKETYINIEHIGHLYQETESGQYGGEVKGRVITRVGCTTHNNGGFKVLETPKQILKMIEKLTKTLTT
jgi:hypothetical protein